MEPRFESLIRDLAARAGLRRQAAARDLGALGDRRALAALVDALDDDDFHVREEAARALGRLRDARALAALEALLDDEKPAVRRAAQEAILALGRPAPGAGGAGPAAPPAEPPAGASRRERLIAAALEGTGAIVDRTPFGFEVEVPLASRKQRVRVIFENTDDDGDRTILVQSLCGPATEKNFRWALRLNLKLAYGHFAIRRHEGEDHFVICQTLLERTTEPDELRKAILAAADRGDWVERQITGGRDEN